MRKKVEIGRLLLCLGGVFLFGCATGIWQRSLVRVHFSPGERILVLPWENFSNYPGGGDLVADLIVLKLSKVSGLTVLSRRELENHLESQPKKNRLERYGPVEGVTLGRELQAHYVVGGVISEMGYLREHRGINEKLLFSGILWVVDPNQGRRVAYYTFSSRLGSDFLPEKNPLTEHVLRTLAPYLEGLLTPSPQRMSRVE